ncbi:MAG: DUF1566 domain-containing protein [Candidatus Thiothrix sulfatifontis]|nr:MAG: DUF1566 domain-containing protein [Candidatus Thiothrix sulfatifontis]
MNNQVRFWLLLLAFPLSACVDKDCCVTTQTQNSIINPTPTGRLNDTGITSCADYAFGDTRSGKHNNDVHCSLLTDVDGDPVPLGQDAVYGRDFTHNDDSDGHAGFSFTKIGASGEALPADAPQWRCVKDNVTGLIWEIKQGQTNQIIGDAGLHDPDDRYTWYNSNASVKGGHEGSADGGEANCSGYSAADTVSYCNTEAYVKRVNKAGLCGASDWRMPSVKELTSLADLSLTVIAIDQRYFPQTQATAYWSNTVLTHVYNLGDARVLAVSFGRWVIPWGSDGALKAGVYDDQPSPTSAYHPIRLVRSGLQTANTQTTPLSAFCNNPSLPESTPTRDFTIHNDRTVTHTTTGLMWKRDTEYELMSWKDALDHVQTLNRQGGYAGYTDWRLPNFKEIQSIVEYCRILSNIVEYCRILSSVSWLLVGIEPRSFFYAQFEYVFF